MSKSTLTKTEGANTRSSPLPGSASDTPRTEIYVLNPQPESVPAEFARELERELSRVVRQRQDYCDILAKIRRAFRDFDNAREAAQFPGMYRPREKDADDLIENVRHILQNVEHTHKGGASLPQLSAAFGSSNSSFIVQDWEAHRSIRADRITNTSIINFLQFR